MSDAGREDFFYLKLYPYVHHVYTVDSCVCSFPGRRRGIQPCVIFSSQGNNQPGEVFSQKYTPLPLSLSTHTEAHTPFPNIPNFHKGFPSHCKLSCQLPQQHTDNVVFTETTRKHTLRVKENMHKLYFLQSS